MKHFTLIFVTVAILTSCKGKGGNSKLLDTSTSVKETFDSTHYFQLEEAYKNNDTLILVDFFNKWGDLSVKIARQNEDSITKTINQIFTDIYHPFNLEKYGWLTRPHYSRYKYAILPTEIKYKLIDINKNPDSLYYVKLDTLRPFYPNPDLGRVIGLYDIEPFKKSLELFLETESYEKSLFLGSLILLPITDSDIWKAYKTDPEILQILINERLDSAVVDLRLISTGLRIKLNFENGEWKMEKIEQLWIE